MICGVGFKHHPGMSRRFRMAIKDKAAFQQSMKTLDHPGSLIESSSDTAKSSETDGKTAGGSGGEFMGSQEFRSPPGKILP